MKKAVRDVPFSSVIPKSTELLGRKIKVLRNSDYIKARDGYYGLANKVSCEIHIANELDGQKIPIAEQEITYFHEIFHLILAKQGYEEQLEKAGIDLEKIVEDLAVGIHQVVTKARR